MEAHRQARMEARKAAVEELVEIAGKLKLD